MCDGMDFGQSLCNRGRQAGLQIRKEGPIQPLGIRCCRLGTAMQRQFCMGLCHWKSPALWWFRVARCDVSENSGVDDLAQTASDTFGVYTASAQVRCRLWHDPEPASCSFASVYDGITPTEVSPSDSSSPMSQQAAIGTARRPSRSHGRERIRLIHRRQH